MKKSADPIIQEKESANSAYKQSEMFLEESGDRFFSFKEVQEKQIFNDAVHQYRKLINEVRASRKQEFDQRMQEIMTDIDSQINACKISYDQIFQGIDSELATATNELTAATNRLGQLKFFQINEKKETTQHIEQCSLRIDSLKKARITEKENMDRAIKSIEENVGRKRKEIIKALDKTHPYPAAPQVPKDVRSRLSMSVESTKLKESVEELVMFEKEITAVAVGEMLHIGFSKAQSVLDQLASVGKVRKQTTRKGDFYSSVK